MGISAACGGRTAAEQASPADADASEGDAGVSDEDAETDGNGFVADVPLVMDSGAPETRDAWVHGIK